MRLVRAAGFALAAGLAACAPPAPPRAVSLDPRVAITPDAAVFADAPIMGMQSSLLSVSVRLSNPRGADVPVLQTMDWIDAAGVPIRSVMSAPRRMTVPRFGDATVQGIAPSPAARDFRLRVEPDFVAASP